MPKIGLCMIVKNEAHVIETCLRSMRPLIDYVLIEDTGSTDGTQDVIHRWLATEGLPGEVFEEPWQDFATNRSLVLQRLRRTKSVDYAFIMDADDTLVLSENFEPEKFRTSLTQDHYFVPIRSGQNQYWRLQILLNRKEYRYRGVLHEFIETPAGSTSGTVSNLYIAHGVHGARSHNPNKYRDDALVLERALQDEQDPFLIARYTFYMAQSWRDADQPQPALDAYLKRAKLGYWEDEVFISLLNAARLKEQIGHPPDDIIETYLRAHRACPHRAEALHGAMRLCRIKDLNKLGFELGNKHDLGAFKPDGLFVEPWVYDYGVLDEYSINAYWAGAYTEALDACLKLLSSDKLPTSHRARVIENAKFSTGKLPRMPDLGSRGTESLLDQHPVGPRRALASRLAERSPRVLLAILAKQKASELPLFLKCIEALDYPKSAIVLYIRTNNNTDGTEIILRDWVGRVGGQYADVEFDASEVGEQVQQFRVHEWNATRFRVLGRIRNISLHKTLEYGCDFYFTADVDNFIRPCTLRELIALDLPIVAPLLRAISPGAFYSNYHAEIDENGYYKACDQYMWVLSRYVRGVIEMPVVHCTYLVRADIVPHLSYEDDTQRHEYVVFSHSARKATVPQYLDNRQVYGYITFGKDEPSQYVEGGIERAHDLLRAELEAGLGSRLEEPQPVAA